jgi:hypothetical protein
MQLEVALLQVLAEIWGNPPKAAYDLNAHGVRSRASPWQVRDGKVYRSYQ